MACGDRNGRSSTKPAPEGKSPPTEYSRVTSTASEDDMADAIQKKVTQKVTDKVLGQVPGIKQAKQLKDKADKIKKFVS